MAIFGSKKDIDEYNSETFNDPHLFVSCKPDNRCIYGGSFDPPTNGHLWMFGEGARLFDNFIVAIGENPEKKCTFNLDERMEMLEGITANHSNVIVTHFDNEYLVNYAKRKDAGYILRGIRDESDFEYERTMRHINDDLDGEISTVFLIPPREVAEISSSLVRGLIGPDGWEEVIKRYVPRVVYDSILHKYGCEK